MKYLVYAGLTFDEDRTVANPSRHLPRQVEFAQFCDDEQALSDAINSVRGKYAIFSIARIDDPHCLARVVHPGLILQINDKGQKAKRKRKRWKRSADKTANKNSRTS